MIMTNLTKKLPIPANISNIWNFGRCLGLFLALQIVTGLLLSSHYTANTNFAFDRIISLSRDTSREPSGSRRGKGFNLALQWIIVYFLLVILFLTWLGGQFVSAPFVMLSQLTFLIYVLVWCFMLVYL